MRKVGIGTEDFTTVESNEDMEFNSYHRYLIKENTNEGLPELFGEIKFQVGPIKENGVNGCHHEDLIAIVIDRLACFQGSEFTCRENLLAITKLEEAMHWLRHRTDARKARGVEGTSVI